MTSITSKGLEILAIFALLDIILAGRNIEEEEYGVKFATDCEVCKLVTKEISEKLESKGSSGVLEIGYNIDSKDKKKKKYNKSELRLVEALEETCQGMSHYRIHKERTDSTRWGKSMSQTFQTLHGLVNKGVKVELGIPYELWDEPSAEVAHLKTQCEQFIEDHEEFINDWYFGEQGTSLQSHICPLILKDLKCLTEPYGEIGPIKAEESPSKQKSKGDSGSRKKAKMEL